MTMKILIMPIFKFINLEKKNSEIEFLTSAYGTNRTLQSVRWPLVRTDHFTDQAFRESN